MQRVKNYGSVLQAFATKKIIENMGHEVEFVDFQTIHSESMENGRIVKIKDRIRLYLACSIKILGLNRLPKFNQYMNAVFCQNLNRYRFDEQIFPSIGINKNKNEVPILDMLIIGSDEVFNYKQNAKAGYSDELFGVGHQAKRLITFSASFGFTKLEDLKNMNKSDVIAGYLKQFDDLSARDYNSLEIMRDLTGVSSQYHLDPVFHYDYSKHLPKIQVKRPYIALYAYSNIENEIREKIEEFAARHQLDVLCFSGYQGSFGTFMDVDAFAMLAYLKHARYVVSSTFHGCVFSIKYNKQFAVLVRKSGASEYSNEFKVSDLLNRLNLKTQILNDNATNLEEILVRNIDYSKVNEQVEQTVEFGLQYLEKNIALIGNEK